MKRARAASWASDRWRAVRNTRAPEVTRTTRVPRTATRVAVVVGDAACIIFGRAPARVGYQARPAARGVFTSSLSRPDATSVSSRGRAPVGALLSPRAPAARTADAAP